MQECGSGKDHHGLHPKHNVHQSISISGAQSMQAAVSVLLLVLLPSNFRQIELCTVFIVCDSAGKLPYHII